MVEVVVPSSLRQAVDIMRESDGNAKYLSGGTALVLLVKMRMLNPDRLVSLREMDAAAGWTDVTVDGQCVRIGGGVTMTQLASHPAVRQMLPSLAHSASVVGNVRIRNCATVGGMMAEADYASDPPATLVSLGATVLAHNGDRGREIPAHDFITDFFTTVLEPDEIVTGVTVPLPSGGVRSTYLKFSSRSAEDRPCVGVAASALFDGASMRAVRVVVGAVSGRPQWFSDVTEPHVGSPLSESAVWAIADGYADAVDPVTDIRGTASYRRHVVRAQVSRALRRIADRVGA